MPYHYSANQETELFWQFEKLKKIFPMSISYIEMQVKHSTDFPSFWNLKFIFLWVQRFWKLKQGVGILHHQADLYTYWVYKISACDLLRRSIFYSLPFGKFSAIFYITSNPICYYSKEEDAQVCYFCFCNLP